MRQVPRPKGPNDVQVSVLIPKEWVEKLDALAERKGDEEGINLSRSDMLRLVIRQGLAAYDEKPPKKPTRRRIPRCSSPNCAPPRGATS
jgi:hypothetical protein